MATAYSRVTLVHGTRRVDLALPSTLPVAEVMPQLLRFCAPVQRPDAPADWRISRVGGADLNPARSLEEHRIADGEVLELRERDARRHSAYVEDVRDAIEDAVDAAGGQWTPASTTGFGLLAGAALIGAAALLPQARAGGPAGAGAAVLVAGIGVAGGWWAARRAGPRVAALVLWPAVGWGVLAGWLGAGLAGAAAPVRVALGLAGGLAVAALARLTTRAATAHLAALAALTLAGVPVALFGLAGAGLGTTPGLPGVAGLRVVGPLAVLVIGALPRVSLTAGGLAGADYRVRNAGLVPQPELAGRLEHSAALLRGALAGTALAGAVAGALLVTGTAWDRYLGVSVACGLILRSRAFSRTGHVAVPRLAGLAVLAVHGLWLARAVPLAAPAVAPLAATVAAVLVALAALPLSEVARARTKRLLNLVEAVVVVGMVTLAAGALGVFGWVAGQTG